MSAMHIPEADIIKMGGWETDYVMTKNEIITRNTALAP